MARVGRLVLIVGGVLLSASSAGAYYHFIHYLNRTAPFQPVPEKFDISALPNRTVTFLVSEAGPAQLASGDSFASVLGQIRQAAQIWNAVESSELRVAFGGLFTPGMPQSTPGGEIVFDELPPGVLAVGGPTAKADGIAPGPAGPFVPILRATVRLNRDLTRRPGPSFNEAFLTMLVHEMGHAIGLQHAFTSGAMSTAVTRSTYRLKPLDADDIAGLSLLYPSRTFLAGTGSIAGRVMAAGQGVHLASVVAIRANGPAVSTLTNPDGTYVIQGLPPDQYFLYTHPLPPATQEGLGRGDIVLPLDPEGRPVGATGATETVFFPGARDPQLAFALPVTRGGRIENVDFNVQRRPEASIFDISVSSFFGQQNVKPAFINTNAPLGTVVVRGPGLTSGSVPPGLSVQVLGGGAVVAPNGIRPYGNPLNLAVDLTLQPGAAAGPRHLVFLTPNDLYVLPSAVHFVQRPPPSISGVAALAEGSVTILGTGFGADTRFFFDGLAATPRGFTGNDGVGTATVLAPPGVGNRAVVTAYNPDGQNSTFIQTASLPSYALDGPESGAIRVEPASVPAGTDAMIEVSGANVRFVEGQTVLGLGSSDVQVKQVWVLSPTRLLATVSVALSAVPGATLASVVNGFQIVTQPGAFQTAPVNPRLPRLSAALVNANANQSGVFAGSVVTLSGGNLTTSPNGATTVVTLNDVRASVVQAAPAQITFQVPAGLPAGPAVLRLFNGQEMSLPVLVEIGAPPPIITAVNALGPLRAGDALSLSFIDTGASEPLDLSRVRVRFNDQDLAPVAIGSQPSQPQMYLVTWTIPQNALPGQASVSIRIGERVSEPFPVLIRAN
jgi:hypothetical protein